jgi:hypothetical protein
LVEGVPSEATACPAAAAQHLAPVTLDDPIDFCEAPEISGDAVVSIVAAKDGVDFADLPTVPMMTATTKCCNVRKVLAMWMSSTDAQV